jgi:Flp pilus assembly pilin Flp
LWAEHGACSVVPSTPAKLSVWRILKQHSNGICFDLPVAILQFIGASSLLIEHLRSLVALTSERRAVTALEYALIAGVIVAVVLVGFNAMALGVGEFFVGIGGNL